MIEDNGLTLSVIFSILMLVCIFIVGEKIMRVKKDDNDEI